MRCHVTEDTECTKICCPFWTAEECAFAKLDLAGRDDLVHWLNALRLTFSDPRSPTGTVRTFHGLLASGKE
jgi:hypothetical protein